MGGWTQKQQGPDWLGPCQPGMPSKGRGASTVLGRGEWQSEVLFFFNLKVTGDFREAKKKRGQQVTQD